MEEGNDSEAAERPQNGDAENSRSALKSHFPGAVSRIRCRLLGEGQSGSVTLHLVLPYRRTQIKHLRYPVALGQCSKHHNTGWLILIGHRLMDALSGIRNPPPSLAGGVSMGCKPRGIRPKPSNRIPVSEGLAICRTRLLMHIDY